MTRKFTRFTILGLIMAPAMAWAAGAMEGDVNEDGLLTIDEMQAVYPAVTAEGFSEMDANGDGALDETEIEAAKAAGLLEALKES